MTYGVSGIDLVVRAQREFETKTLHLRAVCTSSEVYAEALQQVTTSAACIDDVIREISVLGRLARIDVERVWLRYWPLLTSRARAQVLEWGREDDERGSAEVHDLRRADVTVGLSPYEPEVPPVATMRDAQGRIVASWTPYSVEGEFVPEHPIIRDGQVIDLNWEPTGEPFTVAPGETITRDVVVNLRGDGGQAVTYGPWRRAEDVDDRTGFAEIVEVEDSDPVTGIP